MKKFFKSVIAGLLLFCMMCCNNFTDKKGESYKVSVILPANSKSVTYYTQNEVSYYYVQLFNKEKLEEVVDDVEGHPGDQVALTAVEEGDYLITVTAYNNDKVVIAEGKAEISINEENLNPVVKIKIVPNVKENKLDLLILTIDIDWLESDESDSMVDVGDFYISNTDVSYDRWNIVLQWSNNHNYSISCEAKELEITEENNASYHVLIDGKLPVTCVSFKAAVVWCNAASERAGFTPVYYVKDTTNFSINNVVKNIEDADECVVNANADGYRLPTNQEWEVALEWNNENNENNEKNKLFNMPGNLKEWSWDKDDQSNRLFCGESSVPEVEPDENTISFRVVRSNNQ